VPSTCTCVNNPSVTCYAHPWRRVEERYVLCVEHLQHQISVLTEKLEDKKCLSNG
jgi:hypothetical protein